MGEKYSPEALEYLNAKWGEEYSEEVTQNLNIFNGNINNIFGISKIFEEHFRKIDKKEKDNNVICGECGEIMKKSKFNNGPRYWCSCKR